MIFLNKQLCIKLLNNVTVLLKPVHAVRQCIDYGSFLKRQVSDIWFSLMFSSKVFTSSNNRFVLLRRGHRVCAEANTSRVSSQSDRAVVG